MSSARPGSWEISSNRFSTSICSGVRRGTSSKRWAEKTYIQNCAPLTIKHFRSSYKTYRKFVQDDEVTQDSINRFVVEARKADMSVGCLNSYIRGFNSFLDWLFAAELTPTHLRIRLLKQEKKIGRSFTDDELRRMTSFKPKTFSQKRIHVLTSPCLI